MIDSENEENDEEISYEMVEISNTDSENDFFHCYIPRVEVDINAEYADIIESLDIDTFQKITY